MQYELQEEIRKYTQGQSPVFVLQENMLLAESKCTTE